MALKKYDYRDEHSIKKTVVNIIRQKVLYPAI